MNRERMEQLVDIANGLSNDDICWLINALSERCSVFVGLAGSHCLSAGISDAFCNGVEIQINLISADSDSVFEFCEFWAEGLREGLAEIDGKEGGAE